MGSFFPPRNSVDPVRIARLFETAVNARDFDALGLLVTDGVTILDSLSAPLNGRERVIASVRAVVEQMPGLTVSYEEISRTEGGLLVRGHLVDSDRDVRIPSLWDMEFDGPLIARIQAFREANVISLPQFSRQAGLAN